MEKLALVPRNYRILDRGTLLRERTLREPRAPRKSMLLLCSACAHLGAWAPASTCPLPLHLGSPSPLLFLQPLAAGTGLAIPRTKGGQYQVARDLLPLVLLFLFVSFLLSLSICVYMHALVCTCSHAKDRGGHQVFSSVTPPYSLKTRSVTTTRARLAATQAPGPLLSPALTASG